MDKPLHHDKVSSIDGILDIGRGISCIVCNKTNYHPACFALKVIPTKLGVSLKIMFDFNKLLSSFKYTGLPAY